jgi:hypothetical protein
MRNGAAWESSAETGRVVQLHPRRRQQGSPAPSDEPAEVPPSDRPSDTSGPAVADIARFSRRGGDDDYRHRMVMNALAAAACLVLMLAGLWIANTMAQLRKTEDCLLSGRRTCAPLDLPTNDRLSPP